MSGAHRDAVVESGSSYQRVTGRVDPTCRFRNAASADLVRVTAVTLDNGHRMGIVVSLKDDAYVIDIAERLRFSVVAGIVHHRCGAIEDQIAHVGLGVRNLITLPVKL